MLFVVTVGTLITTPISPLSSFIIDTTHTVPFLVICTLVLSIAGFTLGKDLPALRMIGWRIVP